MFPHVGFLRDEPVDLPLAVRAATLRRVVTFLVGELG